MMLWLSSY